MVLSGVGIFLSAYATTHHLKLKIFGMTEAFCNVSATISCDQVAASRFSEILGLPLGVWGLAYFISLLALLYWGRRKETPDLREIYLVAVGVLVSIVLGLISWFMVGALCLTCIGIYLITFLMFLVLYPALKAQPFRFKFKVGIQSARFTAVASVVVVASYFVLKGPWISSIEKFGFNVPSDLEEVLEFQASYADSLRPSALKADFAKGAEKPKVIIVEFADFQCPNCAHFAQLVSRLVESYPDQIRYVFKNFPLDKSCNSQVQSDMHKFACAAAQMAHCAGIYGKFWPYHDRVFAQIGKFSGADLLQYARELGLSVDHMQACQNSSDTKDKIDRDIATAVKLGIRGTPTIFINGRRYTGEMNPVSLKKVVERLVAKP